MSVARVSRKRDISGKSLCRGSEIRELVRASHSWSSSDDVDGVEACGAPLGASRISVCMRTTLFLLAVSIHSLAACRTPSWTCHRVA